jgi:hypothetical protein
MKASSSTLLALAAALLCFNAAAQLKLPKSAPAPAAPAARAASAPAAAPADHSEKEAAAQLAASGWLVLLDRRDWGRAWETSSSVFRTTVPLGTWMDGIPKVRQAMGTFVERTPADATYKTTLEGRPDGEYVTVNFRSKFGERELDEVVTTVREPDGKWRVTGYSTR